MNRRYKSFTRAGMSMTAIAVSVVALLSMTGCGSTGGALSKTADSGAANGGAHGTATGAASGSTSTAPTGTGTGSVNGPASSAKDEASGAWTNLVGGLGNVVVQTGDTVAGLGTTLKVPATSGNPLGDNLISTLLTGTGGAIAGVGGAVTSGLDGVVDGEDAVQILALGANKAAGQVSIDVSDVGSAISSRGAQMPNTLIVSPTLAALGSTVVSTGGGLSQVQFDSAALLTDATVQQVTSALKPVLLPLATGTIEVATAVGDRTGLGAPADTLLVQSGNAVASLGNQISSASSSPTLQGLGGVVAATGQTVAATGGLVDDGQSTSVTPIVAIATTGTGSFQGVSSTLLQLPGGSTLVSALSSGKAVAAPALSSLVTATGAGSAAALVASSAAQGSSSSSSAATSLNAPLSALASVVSGSPAAAAASTTPAPLVPVLSAVIAPVTTVLNTVASSATAPATLSHAGH